MSSGGGARHSWAIAASALVLAVYSLILAVLPKHVFWSPDEGAKFIQLAATGWDGGLRYHLPYLGRATDPALTFYPSHCRYEDLYPAPAGGGAIKFHWPIWFPLAAKPLFALFGATGLYLIPLLCGWLIAVLAGVLASAYRPSLAATAIVLVGFGTPVLFYSLCFWEHTAATLLAMIALTAAVRRPGHLSTVLIAAPCLFTAVALRIEMAAFAAAVAVAWWITVRRYPGTRRALGTLGRRNFWLAIVLAVLALAAGVALLSLTPRYARYVTLLPGALRSNIEKLPHLSDNLLSIFVNAPGLQAPDLAHPWAVAMLVAIGVCWLAPFVQSTDLEAGLVVPALLVALEVSAMLVLAQQNYLSVHGLFPIAPYLLVWTYAVPDAWEARSARLLLLTLAGGLGLVFGFVAIQSIWISPTGEYQTGLEWGPRYFLSVYPVLAVVTLVALHRYRASARPLLLKRCVIILTGALMIVAVQYQARGVRMLYLNKQLIAAWERALDGNEPVLTDVWWLPANAALYYTTHEMHCVQRPEAAAAWLPGAAAAGRRGFTFASFAPLDAATWTSGEIRLVADTPRVVEGLHLQHFRFVSEPAAAETAP